MTRLSKASKPITVLRGSLGWLDGKGESERIMGEFGDFGGAY